MRAAVLLAFAQHLLGRAVRRRQERRRQVLVAVLREAASRRRRAAATSGRSSPYSVAAASARPASLAASARRKDGSNSRAIIALPFICRYGRSSGPPATASRTSDGSSLRPSASARDSAAPSTTATIQTLIAIFRRVPAPTSPSHIVRAPRTSKIGSARSRTWSGPDARMTSLPCSAGAFVPRTGASTSVTPWLSASSVQRSVPAMPIVLICSQMTSSAGVASAPSAPCMTSSTASASLNMVRITLAPRTASAGESVSATPSSASGWARSGERFHARTANPARARLPAIGSPIVPPAPSTAIVVGVVIAAGLPAPAEKQRGPGRLAARSHRCEHLFV